MDKEDVEVYWNSDLEVSEFDVLVVIEFGLSAEVLVLLGIGWV